MSNWLPSWLIEICKDIDASGGKAFLVGGSVRDQLLGYPIKDFDIEVYGLPSEKLRKLLERHGKVSTVGEHFAIYKVSPYAATSHEIDISLPRRESKHGLGHRGFVIQGDPWMTFEEATSRRDFTINAILQDPLSGNIIDPCHGLKDLINRELRVVNPNTFSDDSLRVLRAAQLSSRYNLRITSETKFLCQKINLKDIPKERIWDEVKKLLLLSPAPSVGMKHLLELGVIEQLFPMLWELHSSLLGEPPYPRESAWNHVLASLDRSKEVIEELNEPEQLSILISIIGVRLSSKNLMRFLDSLGLFRYQGYDLRSQIIVLKRIHLLPYKIFYQTHTKNLVAPILRRIARLTKPRLLICLSKAIYSEVNQKIPTWLSKEIASTELIENSLFRGHHFLEIGLSPGPEVGKLLRQALEYQIEGKVKDNKDVKRIALALSLRGRSGH